MKSEIARVRADSKVEEFMALEASASVQTFQQLNNMTMIDLDQLRSQISALQKENDSLKEEMAQQKVGSFQFSHLTVMARPLKTFFCKKLFSACTETFSTNSRFQYQNYLKTFSAKVFAIQCIVHAH